MPDEDVGAGNDPDRGETDVPGAGPGDDASTDLDAGDAPSLDNLEGDDQVTDPNADPVPDPDGGDVA